MERRPAHVPHRPGQRTPGARGWLLALLGALILGCGGHVQAHTSAVPASLALSPAETAWLATHPVVRLGIDPNYGPYSFLDEKGQLQGVVREFLTYSEQTLGLRFEIVSNLTWPQLMAAVQEKRIDAVATVVRLPEREAFLEFTRIYLPAPLVIMTRNDARQLRSLRDLQDLRLTLVEGYSSSKQVVALYPEIRPAYVATPLDGLRAVASGMAEAYVGVLGVNTFLATQHGFANLKVNAAFDMAENGQRFAVRKDWPQLAGLLDRALAAMPAKQRADIWHRWIPVDAAEIRRLSQPTLATRLFPWLLGFLGLGVLAYAFVLLWNHQLKQQLARRRQELAASADRLGVAETIAHVGNWQYRVADGELRWSDETYRIFGLAPQSRHISYNWLIAHVHPDDRAWHEAYLHSMLESRPGETIPDGQYRLVRISGEERTVRVRVQIEFDTLGRPVTLFGILQDVSDEVRANERIAALNRLYRVLSGSNEAIVRLRDPQALFDKTCRIAVEVGGLRMAWIGLADADNGEVRPLAHAGTVGHYLENLHISLGDDEHGRGPTGTALRCGRHMVSNDIANDPDMAPWREAALALGYQASAAFPLRVGGQVRGVFSLYAARAGFFDDEELRLLDDLAQDIGFALEFSEVDRARETLNRRMVDMLESMSDGFVSLDRNWHYLYVNRKAGEMLGRAPGELVGRNIWTEFPEGIGQAFHQAYQRAMNEGVMLHLDEYFPPWDMWFENRIYPTLDGISIFFTDITERKKQEEELKRLHSTLDALVEGSSDAIFVKDRDGCYVVANQAAASLLGSPIEKILGADDHALFPADLADRFRADDQRIMAARVADTYEEPVVTPTGTFIHLTTKGPLIIDGEVRGVFGIARDITGRKRVEAALLESDTRLRLFIDHAPAALAMFDRQMRYLAVSKRWLTDYGLGEGNVLGRCHYEVLPEISANWKEVHRRGLAGEVVRADEDRFDRADGSVQWLHWEVRPWYAFDGVIGGIVVFSEDITERKEASQALQESEARYRQLFEHSPAPMLVYEKGSLRLLAVNEAFSSHYGYSRDEALALRLPDLYPDTERQRLIDLAAKLTGLAYVGEWHHLKKDGNPITIEARSHDLRYEGHTARVAVITDITQRKLAEQALREQEEFFRLIAENMGDMVTVLDPAGRRLYNSPSYRALFGDPEQMKGTDAFVSVHPDDRERVHQAFQATVESGVGQRGDLRVMLADGSVREIESQSGVIRGADGRVARVVVVSRDVTERKRLADEIHQLNAALEERVRQRTAELAAANKELETFTYSVSHDLKAPLRGIDGYSRLLLEHYTSRLDDEGRMFLNNVRHGVAQMGELIEDMLAYSRMERRSLNDRTLDLAGMVAKVLDERRADIEGRGMRVEVALQGLSARADAEGLVMVLRNLIDNALKFTRDSQPPILTIHGTAAAKSVILEFQDNGIGFDMQFHDRIFNIFQRLQRAEDYPGTGVGLAIVYKAMQRMGGRVWAESTPGQGATFFLELPR